MPGTAHSPNPDLSGEMPASEVEKLKGAGSPFPGETYGGDPAGEAAEIAAQGLGNLQMGPVSGGSTHEPAGGNP